MGNLINMLPVTKPQITGIANKKTPDAQNLSNKYQQVEKYDYLPARPLAPANRTPVGIKVNPAEGHLVYENIFQSAASTAKSYADYIKYFYNAAFNGKGTDYSVGKINDLAIRAGSLGIATVLAGTKIFPFAKGMEFVGLGTWFAAMAVWPKILAAPIKSLYGVNINQKYVDSYGRRKNVFDDNKYRPMDIYRHVDVNGKPLSAEKYHKKYAEDYVYLEKIADKLGIPKDIKNRREATINQMSQVAVQGKTLWMLTAGVMTPVLSSIVADALQKPVRTFIGNKRVEKQSQVLDKLEAVADKLLCKEGSDLNNDIDKVTEEFGFKQPENLLKKVKSLYSESGRLSEAEYNELENLLKKRYWGTGYYTVIESAMSKDSDMAKVRLPFDNKLKADLTEISGNVFKKLLATYPEKSRHLIPKEIWEYKGMNNNDVSHLLSNIGADFGENLSQHQMNALKSEFASIIVNNYKKYTQTDNPEVNNRVAKFLDVARKSLNNEIEDCIGKNKRYLILEDKLFKIINFANLGTKLKYTVAQYERATIDTIAESLNAVNWEMLPKGYAKALGFSRKELLILASTDNNTAGKIVRNKIEEIVKNPSKYQKVVKKMSLLAQKVITKDEEHVLKLIGTPDTPGLLFKLKSVMQNLAGGNFGNYTKDSTEVVHYGKIADIQRKFRNTIDSFCRPINAFDTFKNIDSVVEYMIGDPKMYANRQKIAGYYMFHNVPYEKAFESTKGYVKDVVLMRNDINNWTTKMETELPGLEKGLKYSKEMVCSLSDMVFGDLHSETSDMILKKNNSFIKRIFNKITKKTEPDMEPFVNKLRINNKIMRARYLNIHNPLLPFMTIDNPLGGLIHDLYSENNAKKSAEILLEMLNDKMADLATLTMENGRRLEFEQLQTCQKILNAFKTGEAFKGNYNRDDAIRYIRQKGLLTFNSTDVAISQVSGKGVFEFFQTAAQNIRSRNKWTKVAYGLLGGTLAVSAITIANMGKPNSLNSHSYEKKQDKPKGDKQ